MEVLKKILIIEDEPDFLQIYADLLGSRGYQVSKATEGNQGLKLVYEEMPDLILLDLVLPGRDGMEIIQMIKEDSRTKNIPVIVFSVLDTTDKIQQAIKLGASDYLIKGVAKPTEILHKIEMIIGNQNKDLKNIKFRLAIEKREKLSLDMADHLGVESGLECPKCRVSLEMELIPDGTRSDGHWFAAHFICPSCHQSF